VTKNSNSTVVVENYLAFPIPEILRQQLQDFLSNFPAHQEEFAYASLLHLGLVKTLEMEDEARMDADDRRNAVV
jgi:hypothetical protein